MDDNLTHYEDVKQEKKTLDRDNGVPMYKYLVYLCILFILCVVVGIGACAADNECKPHLPTLNNMMNSTFSSRVINTGVHAAIAAHILIVVSLYHCTSHLTPSWSRIQALLAVITYLVFAVDMLVGSFTGWKSDWGNMTVIIFFGAWIASATMAIRSMYHNAIGKERLLLRISTSVVVLYIVCTIIYIVLESIPVLGYPSPRNRAVGILIIQLFIGLSTLIYLILVTIHIRRVHWIVFIKASR